MQSKNKKVMTAAERKYVELVRALSCAVCNPEGEPYRGQSEAHEIEQGLWWVSVPLCPDCHRGPHGWHGDKALWKIRKLDEIKVLNDTIRRVIDICTY